MADAHLPILHHFEASPFSEKIRIIFGVKDIAWQSSLIPRILPKPDLVPLTGGYRRTPVLQIGADIYCDTQMIQRAIEARYRTPALFPADNAGVPWLTGLWTDRIFFTATVNLVFGTLGDAVPQSFIEDRARLRNAPFDVKAMTAALPHHRDQFRAQVALLEAQLAHGQPFLLGDFSLLDAGAYMNVWYVRSNIASLADELLSDFPNVCAWEQRVRALGHGSRSNISGADAIEIAKAATPVAGSGPTEDAEGRKVGDRVRIIADEPVRTTIRGEIVSLSVHHIAVLRSDPKVGDVVVHFPRLGYIVAPA